MSFDTDSPKSRTFNNPFIPLRKPNFRYYWTGMWVSLTGNWMQSVAQPWLAYSLTNSPLLLGLVGAMQFLPVLLFALFAGVVVDRINTKRLIYFTQAASMVIVLILTALVYTQHIQYWHIVILAFALGLVNTLDMPARQAFVIQLVGREDLMNAIALNSVAFNTARVIGPAVAGLLIGAYGVGICFLLNSLSFGAVIISLLFIVPLPYEVINAGGKHIWADVKAGLLYVRQHRDVLEAIILLAIIGTFALNNNVLVPVFNQEVLGQGARGFGFLLTFSGVGSMIGALAIAAMSSSGPRKWIIFVVPAFISLFLILNSFTHNFWVTGFYLAVTGLFFNLFASTVNSTVQLNTTNEFRGRVMSIYSLVFVGSTPIGNLYAGLADEYLGARYGFAACGLMTLLLLIPVYIYTISVRKQAREQQPS